MTGYIAKGVLIGLHRHKAGQCLAIQKTSLIFVWFLALVITACVFYRGSGGQKTGDVFFVNKLTLLGNVYGGSPSSSDFPTGYVGKIRIVNDNLALPLPSKGFPKSGQHSYSALGEFEYPHQAHSTSSTDYDFGLPDPPPLWRFTERGLPDGVIHKDITLSQPPQAVLVNPLWPPRAWLVDDTAVVEGYLTFHAHGLLSFELLSESHPGFGAAVQEAINQSTCFPSVDKSGRRITVSCRYRCLFFHGSQPSISVGRSIVAKIKKD